MASLRKSAFLIVCTSLLAVHAATGQTITGADGVYADGEVWTIHGSGFGDLGPSVVMFDDFEGGPVGSIVQTSARVGQWDQVVSTGSPAPSAYYSDASAVSGTRSFRSNQLDGVSRMDLSFGDQTEIFGCWWIRHEGTGFPNNGAQPPVVNWKTVWLWELPLGIDGGNDIVLPTGLGTTDVRWQLAGNRTGFGTNISGAFGTWSNNIWRRVAFYINVDQATGVGDLDFWTCADGDGLWRRTITMRNEAISVPGHTYRGLGMNGYAYASNPDSHPMFDDFYCAVGPGAQARVEIGDSANYLACSQLAIQVPTQWSNEQITIDLRLAQFLGAGPVYLFVVNADGAVSGGYELDVAAMTEAPGAPGAPERN
jgi:hypothetical protein